MSDKKLGHFDRLRPSQAQLPKGWERRRLGEVCEIKPPKKEARDKLKGSDFVTFLPMSDLGVLSKEIITSQKRKLKDVSGSYTYFAENDVLLAKITPCFENGKIGIARNLTNGIGFGSSEYIVFRSKGDIIQDYLYYFLSIESFRDEGKKYMTGAVGHKRVSKEFIENYLLPFPKSLPEQKRIIAILDKAFAAIAKAKANAEQNLKNAKELFESYLQGVFEDKGEDWKEIKLGAITSKIGSGATPRGGQASYKTEGISLVRSMNVHDFDFRDKNLAFIDEKQADALSNVTLQENDILLNITGASIARCCIIPKEYLPARVNQHVSIIRANKEIISPLFLSSLLTSKFYKDQILETGEQGATRQAITKAQLETFAIAFPKKIREQEIIIEKMHTLSAKTKKLESIYQQKIDNLEELKKSVLQKAFGGEL